MLFGDWCNYVSDEAMNEFKYAHEHHHHSLTHDEVAAMVDAAGVHWGTSATWIFREAQVDILTGKVHEDFVADELAAG